MRSLRHRCVQLLLLATLLGLSCGQTLAQPTPTISPWNRIVMIGASASAGFVFSEPFGGTNTSKCRLNHYLDAALNVSHEPVRNLANAMFFLFPEQAGRMQIEQAVKARPTLVVGVDFLFWFCYGRGTNDTERLERFENGLKLLEDIKTPLVLGFLPDASFATNSGIISPAQVASATALAAANARLKTWAATRPQVVLVPLSDFMRAAMANQALTVHGQTLPAGKTRAILQNDFLHPAPRGAAWLALGILDAVVTKLPAFRADAVRWNPEEVFQIGTQAALPRPKPPTTLPAEAPAAK